MVEAAGIPVGLATDGANRNDCKLTEWTILSIAIERPEPTWRLLRASAWARTTTTPSSATCSSVFREIKKWAIHFRPPGVVA
jgi:hypothetical protein